MNYQLDDEAWELALDRMAAYKIATVVIDRDVMGWFKEQGCDYQSLIDSILLDYVDAHSDRQIPDDLRPARYKIDWGRLDAMRDEDIDFSDIPEITVSDPASATVWPPLVARNSVAIYSDVYEWFAAHDRIHLRTINTLLGWYMEAQRSAVPDMPTQSQSRL